jgi:hypothetical protein
MVGGRWPSGQPKLEDEAGVTHSRETVGYVSARVRLGR